MWIGFRTHLRCPACKCALGYDDSIFKVVIVVAMGLLSPLTLGASAGLTYWWPSMPLEDPALFMLFNLLIYWLGTIIAFRRGWLQLYCKI